MPKFKQRGRERKHGADFAHEQTAERSRGSRSGGQGVKKEKSEREQTTIRLPAELKEELQREADRKGISLNALVLMILNEEQNHRPKE